MMRIIITITNIIITQITLVTPPTIIITVVIIIEILFLVLLLLHVLGRRRGRGRILSFFFLYYRGIQMHREIREGKVRQRRGREKEREREGEAYGPGSNSVLFNLFDPVLMIIILSTM